MCSLCDINIEIVIITIIIKNVRGSNTPSQQAGGRTQTHSPPAAAAATVTAATAGAAAASAATTVAGSSGTQLQAAGGSTNKRYPNSAPYVRGTATTQYSLTLLTLEA